MKTFFLTIALFMVACNISALAQVTASTTAALITPSHLRAAETMLGMASSAESYNKGIDQKLALMYKQLPEGRDTQANLRAFISKYLSWESIQSELAALYASKFSEAELREIISFYQTPAGQKLARIGPQLSQARMDIGQRRLQEHMAEFEQLFQK